MAGGAGSSDAATSGALASDTRVRLQADQPVLAHNSARYLEPSIGIDTSIDVEIEPLPAWSQIGDPHGTLGATKNEVVTALAWGSWQITEQIPAAEVADHGYCLTIESPRFDGERSDRRSRGRLRFRRCADAENELFTGPGPFVGIAAFGEAPCARIGGLETTDVEEDSATVHDTLAAQ